MYSFLYYKDLWAIVCWDIRLTNDDEVEDLVGDKRTLKITRKRYKDEDVILVRRGRLYCAGRMP